jgi:hypothetical protein
MSFGSSVTYPSPLSSAQYLIRIDRSDKVWSRVYIYLFFFTTTCLIIYFPFQVADISVQPGVFLGVCGGPCNNPLDPSSPMTAVRPVPFDRRDIHA